MKGEIILKNPILVNGKQIKKLRYDANEITAQLFVEADSRNIKGMGTAIAETDCGLHLYLGFASVIAVNSEIDFSDLERVKGTDITTFMRIGRNFTIATSEEISSQDSSEATSDVTPELLEAQ